MTTRQCDIIGAPMGWGARDPGTADGPTHLTDHCPEAFCDASIQLPPWQSYYQQHLFPARLSAQEAEEHLIQIIKMATWLADLVESSIINNRVPFIFGGDHSIAIGTWSGIKSALKDEDMGLIWIDAHMDANTPETSPSLNVHGMPVAVLLGQGDQRLTSLKGSKPKLKPENLVLIGVRSYEEGEAKFLADQGVRIYRINEVQERGFHTVFQEARNHIKTKRIGLSIDVDAFDPEEAPGTGTLEANGLKFYDVAPSLKELAQSPDFLGLEIAEFNPHKDIDNRTCKLVWELVTMIMKELNDDDKYRS